jgi:peptidyl-tRNA hydrolase, PTH1 family
MSTPAPILIAGLGNPGAEYAATRHNAGFWFADAVVDRHRGSWRTESKFFGDTARVKIAGVDVLLLKPATFMNRSGQAVRAMMGFYKLQPSALLVAHDELDLPAGDMRLKLGGGHGGHNGLRDIHKPLGEGYRRLRIGIGHPGDKNLVLNYVLGRPSKADEQAIRVGIEQAVDALPVWLAQSWDKALQQLHTRTAG